MHYVSNAEIVYTHPILQSILSIATVLFTVLNIGGVSIGSFWSKIILAVASIRKRLLTCSLALTEKVTNPCPSVPLFGGRKPMLGSTGASPALESNDVHSPCNPW